MSEFQKAERVQQIRNQLKVHDTQFLLDIWTTNDLRDWTPEAFEAIREILLARLGSVPAQQHRDPREWLEPKGRRQRLLLTRLEGRIEFPYLSTEDAQSMLRRLSAALSAQQATDLHLSEHRVTFSVGMFRFVSNWNLLVPVDEGEIIVQPGTPGAVGYRFSFMRMFAITTLMALVFCLPGFVLRAPILAFLVPAIVWLFLFGLNYLIAVFRLEDFMWQSISHLSHS